MRKLPIILCLLFLISGIFHSCEVDNCPPNALSFAQFVLVDQYNRPIEMKDPVSIFGEIKTDVTITDTLADGTVKEHIVKDSLIRDTLINEESNMSKFSIPLSFESSTRIIISYNNGALQDEIDIQHRNIPYFYNLDCGTMMFYEVTNATSSTRGLDSISITNPNIDNNEKENFKIYFTHIDAE